MREAAFIAVLEGQRRGPAALVPAVRASLDTALAELQAHEDAWVRVGLAERILLLRENRQDLLSVAEPWVGAGMTDDIDGEPRPQGAGYDLRADETWLRGLYLPLLTKESRTELDENSCRLP